MSSSTLACPPSKAFLEQYATKKTGERKLRL